MIAIAGVVLLVLMLAIQLMIGMTRLGAMSLHILSMHRLRHCMRFSRQHAETAHYNLHSEQHRHQASHRAGTPSNMHITTQHAAYIKPAMMKIQ